MKPWPFLLLSYLTLLSPFSPPLGAEVPKAEPTNAAESAAQKAAAEKKVAAAAALNARYEELISKLPPEEQAWERTLQSSLGGFYLPLHQADKLAGKSNAWDFVKDDPSLPRILLIGDSVSRGYTQPVRAALSGKANVHRAPENCGPTANGVKKIELWLADGKWDVIHFNFGIHDRATPLTDYAQRLEQLVERMKTTGAKIVWATTTPIPDDPAKHQSNAAIVERNTAAAAIMSKHGVLIDDLFTAITPKLSTLQNPNDVHFTPAGYDFLGEQVAASILSALKH